MENILVALITLGGLYTIAQQEQNETFVQKPCPEQNQLVESKKSLESVPAKYTDEKKDTSFAKTFTTLSGEKISVNDLKHNNEVHYYGTNAPGNNDTKLYSDTILDNKIGTGSTSINKKCQGPLFKPQENINWIHGTPNNNDFIKERMAGNISNKKNNTKPWTSENIGPGLTGGYDSKGTHGYNSGMMSREKWAPKTVDDLRTINNPKVTYNLDEHMGPASSIIQNRGELGKMEQHKPNTFSFHGPSKYFTSVVHNNQMNQPNYILDEQNRETTNIEYKGAPTNGSYPTATKSDQNFEIKKEHIYGEMKGIPGMSNNQMLDNPYVGYNNKDNYRSKNKQEELYGNIQGVANMIGAVNPILDTLKPTRKELIIENLYKDGNISKIGAGGQYVYDPNDIPKPTIRQSTNYSVSDNNVMVNDNIDLINGNNSNVLFPDTNRSHRYSENIQPAGATGYGVRDHDYVNNQRNNNNKESRTRISAGNTNIFNHTINVKQIKHKERDVQQTRQNVPDRIRDVMPNQQQIGIVNMPKEIYPNVNERLNPTLLDAFKKNPFTHSLTSVA